MNRRINKKWIIPFIAILTLPVVLLAQRQIQQILSRAAPKPANIIIETKSTIGPVNKSWAAFSQGGEEAPPELAPVVPRMKELSPRYIRLDHIYDANNVVSKSGSGYTYNFSVLDKTVKDIINMGAIPFFSLSYMPPGFTSSGSLIDTPADWNNWKNLVKATIEHYSGKNNLNLSDVYYEVWNEPELPQFGSWRLEGGKDYRELYFYAAGGANEASNVNKFFLGGPAVGSYYPNWVSNFASYASQNNLRLDFYSWHRYTKRPYEYVSDAQNIRNILAGYPAYANIPLVLTEWGIDSENSDINNTNTAAAYAVYAAAQFQNNISLAFNFEVKDGPPPTGGKWGLLYHQADPKQPLSPKPKFKAFRELAQLSGGQILLSGDGTYISGLAAGSPPNTISAVLANYDPNGQNIENVPVTFTGLSPSVYLLKYRYPLDNRSGFYEIPVTNGTFSKTFLMPANSLLSLELSKGAKLATFINGVSGDGNDKALVLGNIEEPLTFSNPEFHLLPQGTISFDFKPFWDKNDTRSFFILEAPFEIKEGTLDKLSLSKQNTPEGNIITFTITQKQQEISIPVSISNWDTDTWHHLDLGWNQAGFWIASDGEKTQKSAPLDVRNGKILTFSPIEAAIDNLKIEVGKNITLERNFDGRMDK